jgi:hypothetical protein
MEVDGVNQAVASIVCVFITIPGGKFDIGVIRK